MKKETLHVVTFRNGAAMSITVDGTIARLSDMKGDGYPVDELAALFASMLPNQTNGATSKPGKRGKDTKPRRAPVPPVERNAMLKLTGATVEHSAESKIGRVSIAVARLCKVPMKRGALERALMAETKLTRQQVTVAVSRLLHQSHTLAAVEGAK